MKHQVESLSTKYFPFTEQTKTVFLVHVILLKKDRKYLQNADDQTAIWRMKMAEQNNQKGGQAKEQDINQLLKVRREKLANLQEAGKDPFVITK